MAQILSHYNLAIIIQEQRRGNAVRALQQDLVLVQQRLPGVGGAMGKTANKTGQFVTKVKSLAEKLRRVLVPALLLATLAASNFAKNSVREFAEFDKDLRATFTLIPEASEEFKNQLSDDIRVVSQRYGKLTDETLPALYVALSAGMPKENAIEAIELASKAAIAGVSDLETTMKVGMAIFNAYGGEVYTLNEVYDIMFELIDKGVPKLSDWGAALQHVISIASETRTPFEGIATALAVMTRQGDSAAEAAEILGFLLMQLGLDGTEAFKTFVEATGMTYRQWLATGKDFIDGLNAMDQHAKDTGESLSSMIGGGTEFYRDLQAARAVLEITGIHMQEINDLAFEGSDVIGSMGAAYITASDNAEFSLDKMGASWDDFKIEVGEAFWEGFLGPGATGKDMVTYATDIIRALGGNMAREAKLIQGSQEIVTLSLSKIRYELFQLADLPSMAWSIGDKDGALTKQLLELGGALARQTDSAKYFGDIMEESGFTAETWQGRMFVAANMTTEAFYSQQQALATNQIVLDALANTDPIDPFSLSPDAFNNLIENMEVYNPLAEEFVNFTGEMSTVQDDLWAGFENSIPHIQGAGEMIHWVNVETHALQETTLGYMDAVGANVGDLFDAYDKFSEASGEWREVLVDNTGQVQRLLGELSADLTEDQKEAMWEIVRTAEEGGSEWLRAWRGLQSDLTETQRFELVARLADLMEAQGTAKGIWTGDREAAEEAAENIIEAFGAIDLAYQTLAQNIAEENIISRFGEDTWEAQKAIIAFRIASGDIDPAEGEFLLNQFSIADNLKPILDEMWTAYLADLPLTKTELDNIITATDILNTAHGDLTTEGLKAYINKALSETGGYPYVAGLIYDIGEEVDETKEKAKLLAEAPIVPEVELDKSGFDMVYNTMMEEITASLGPHTVLFEAQYNNFRKPGAPETDADQATGTGGYLTVPGGHPNDSYLVGLTSGEQYNVIPQGQNLEHGRQYNDNSVTNVIFNNHSKAAAALSRAQLDTIYDRRLRRFAGD